VAVSLSTHVLDAERGRPAQGVRVELYRGETLVSASATDGDGRVSELAADLDSGGYRLVFLPPSPFFRRLDLEIELDEGHFHVPLLLSPYSCTIYRGS
jgi:5-hydroxyisourate hydrolase